VSRNPQQGEPLGVRYGIPGNVYGHPIRGECAHSLYKALRKRAKENGKSIAAGVISLLEENIPTEEELKARRRYYERMDCFGSQTAASSRAVCDRGGDAEGGSRTLSTVVVDASVAMKWVFPNVGEELTDVAVDLLKTYVDGGRLRIVVPDIFWAELGNIARKGIRQSRWSRALAENAVADMRTRKFPTGILPSASFRRSRYLGRVRSFSL
jgi:predicted nucleic acid-binding protein